MLNAIGRLTIILVFYYLKRSSCCVVNFLKYQKKKRREKHIHKTNEVNMFRYTSHTLDDSPVFVRSRCKKFFLNIVHGRWKMKEEANQLYRRPQMTGQAREEEEVHVQYKN